MDKLSSQVRKMCKLGWMDSIAFHHELPYKPVNEVYSSKSVCRMKHPCIENCERCSDEPYPCHAMRVYVVDADALETLLPQIEAMERNRPSKVDEEHARLAGVPFNPAHKIESRTSDAIRCNCGWEGSDWLEHARIAAKCADNQTKREDALIKDALYIGQCVPQRIALNYDTLIKFVRSRLARKEQAK